MNRGRHRLLPLLSILQTGKKVPVRIWRLAALAAAVAVFALPALSQAPPFVHQESLVYEITWPSGLSLGEAQFTAMKDGEGWSFEAVINAALPTMNIDDEYRSRTDGELCSKELIKKVRHGEKKLDESVAYDQKKLKARRSVAGAKLEEVDIPPCGRDGLAFLYYLRSELAAGRVPPPDDLNFGPQYQVVVSYAESIEVEGAGQRSMADRMLVDLTGPNSQRSFEIFVGKDQARTPLLMRIPFDLGTFSLKLLQ